MNSLLLYILLAQSTLLSTYALPQSFHAPQLVQTGANERSKGLSPDNDPTSALAFAAANDASSTSPAQPAQPTVELDIATDADPTGSLVLPRSDSPPEAQAVTGSSIIWPKDGTSEAAAALDTRLQEMFSNEVEVSENPALGIVFWRAPLSSAQIAALRADPAVSPRSLSHEGFLHGLP